MRRWFIHMSLVLGTFGCGDSQGSKSRGPQVSEGDPDRLDRAQEKPQIAFVSPSRDLETDQDVEVQVKFSGDTKRLTWNLYFVAVDSSPKVEQLITEGNGPKDSKVTWNTASVSPGTYKLVATFSSPSGKGRVQSAARLEIKEAGRPTVTITSPEPEQVLVATSPHEIALRGLDPNGTAMTFKIEVSPDNGKSWATVAENLPKSTYSWNMQKLPQGSQYKLKVTATNSRGLKASTVMAKPFGIAAEPITYATKMAALLASKCGSCHGIGAINAPQFRSDSFDLATIGVSAKADAIKKRTLDGTMPPNGKLTSAELDLVTLWHWSGAQ